MAMVAVTATLLGFFAFVILRVTTPQMTTLFTDLSTEDSSGVVKELERQAIPFKKSARPCKQPPRSFDPQLSGRLGNYCLGDGFDMVNEG